MDLTASLLILPICLGLGVIFDRAGRLPDNAGKIINVWLIDVALPALVLVQVPKLHLDLNLLLPISCCWVVFFGGVALLLPISRLFGWPPALTGALILTCGLGNTSFVGFPLIEALRGKDALGIAVLLDQLGSTLLVATAGIATAAFFSGGSTRPGTMAKKVLLFLPFIAILIAFLLLAAHQQLPAVLEPALSRLGQTLTPLAIFAIGLRLRLGSLRQWWAPISLGLSWKLLLAPLLMWAIGSAFKVRGLPLDVTVLEAAMGPMVTGGILAEEAGLMPEMIGGIVGGGILISLVTVPLFSWLLGW
jgi:predicted permease